VNAAIAERGGARRHPVHDARELGTAGTWSQPDREVCCGIGSSAADV